MNDRTEPKLLSEEEVVESIAQAFHGLSGKEIANVHNDVCAEKIEYAGDSMWRYTGESDCEEE